MKISGGAAPPAISSAFLAFSVFLVGVAFWSGFACGRQVDSQKSTPISGGADESRFITEIRQLTFDGRRSGEGYFNADGSKMIFQSERESGNPFYQIYLLDFDSGETIRVSPGVGKTTCSWIHPSNTKALFASTHEDPDSLQKQAELIALRESGNEPRYAWDYDENFELFEKDLESGEMIKLTDAVGYDAEGCYSPDGNLVVFASNRAAYSKELTEKERKLFDVDRSFMMDIYIMNADGSNVRQLTDVPGYDGGPFFSHDGSKICWRRFSENGLTAEVFTMNIDGSDQKQLTRLNAMSWAPFFHPSGDYLIFNTNVHGMGNFELFIVDANGKSEPVRITTTDGFDGLASFTPDGKSVTWTSNRTNKQSQIYLGNWNHEAALAALRSSGGAMESAEVNEATATAMNNSGLTRVDYSGLDMMKHVDFLCHPRLAGRMTGSSGEKQATAYVAAYFDHLGLVPAGDNGSWYQEFEFPASAEFGDNNSLAVGDSNYELNRDWRPLTFSKSGRFDSAEVVFAGYGISAAADDENEAYDSYAGLDVEDRWVLALRYVPEKTEESKRQFFTYNSSLRKKAMDARDRGARGIIFVSGPGSAAREELVPLEKDFSMAGTSIAVVSVTDAVASGWLKSVGRELGELQNELDTGEAIPGFVLNGVRLNAEISLRQNRGVGRNVVGRLRASEQDSETAIVVGAHIDHLGKGRSSNSLARDEEANMIHAGADDNASGVAAMLEVAEHLAMRRKSGDLKLKRDVIFAAWSGEELGLFGSQHFVEQLESVTGGYNPHGADPHGSAAIEAAASGTGSTDSSPHGSGNVGGGPPSPHGGNSPVTPQRSGAGVVLAACLNMDMVGRYDGTLVLQGVGSSPWWASAAELNSVVGLNLKLSNDCNLPTDASSFYRSGVPILSAFTGSHPDYHTPRDTPEKLNYEAAAKIAKLMGLITRKLATSDELPVYQRQETVAMDQSQRGFEVYLGSIPDYTADVAGTRLEGVKEGGPMAKAGIQAGDIIVELAGKKIENVYDYSFAMKALKAGEESSVVVMRGESRLTFKVVPARR